MTPEALACKIVEAVLARLDDHVRRYGLASVDDDLKQVAIEVVVRMIREDREYF